MLAIIGGDAGAFRARTSTCTTAPSTSSGQDALPVGVHSPGHIAETDKEARDELWPHYRAMHDRIGRERGWPPTTRGPVRGRGRRGLALRRFTRDGGPKIAETVRTLGVDRFELKYGSGTLAHEQMMTTIGLYGAKVMPRVRELLAD